MPWPKRWWIFLSHQPLFWGALLGRGLLVAGNTWALLRLIPATVHWWLSLLTWWRLSVHAVPHAMPPSLGALPFAFSWESLVSTGVTLLTMGLVGGLYWLVRVAWEHPAQPLSWRDVGRDALWAPVRLLLAFLVLNALLSAVALPLVGGGAWLFLVWLGPSKLSLPGLLGAAVVLLLVLTVLIALTRPWLAAAVLEHPAWPPQIWQRYWAVWRRFWWGRWLPLALGHMLLLALFVWPAMGLAWQPALRRLWLYLSALKGPWTGVPRLGLAPMVGLSVARPGSILALNLLGYSGLLALEVGWATAYWDARQILTFADSTGRSALLEEVSDDR